MSPDTATQLATLRVLYEAQIIQLQNHLKDEQCRNARLQRLINYLSRLVLRAGLKINFKDINGDW